MIAGYVRLSRDDEKQNYISIKHQKLIISRYAASRQMSVDQWYEDDGYSGYTFERPGFRRMMEDAGHHASMTILIKDFSRLGRHNAKVLLFLEECKKREIRLIVIDDSYDSFHDEDDLIGIKTWYNERYIKDTSRKIRRALHARQQEGTLLIHLPYGYEKCASGIRIRENQAYYIRMIFQLYLSGSGCRSIAARLTADHVPTPSMCRHQQSLQSARPSTARIALQWSEHMVRDIINNDFYTGTCRLHKRARRGVHGSDHRIPREEQYIFPDHHPAIISKEMFEEVQTEKNSRFASHFHGSAALSAENTSGIHKYRGLIFCRECGSRLTPITRRRKGHTYLYYVCSAYNRKGKQFCAASHLIHEKELDRITLSILRTCRDQCQKELQETPLPAAETSFPSSLNGETQLEIQLRLLLEEKLRLISDPCIQNQVLLEQYQAIEKNLLRELEACHLRKEAQPAASAEKETPLSILDAILEGGSLLADDVIHLIDRIIVGTEHTVTIFLREEIP